MDLTQVFKASVMAVKLQRKIEVPVPDKNRILPPKGAGNSARDEFAKQAKDICHKITQLRNVLLENRGAYMKIAQHLKGAAHMTDEQRDLIDRESEKFVTYYTQHLAQLREDWKSAKRKPHHSQHMEAVFHLLEAYLKEVQTIYLEQKKYRVQHELETYRLLKLAADKKEIPVRPGSQTMAKKPRRLNSASSEEEKESAEDKVDEARNAKKRMDNDDSDSGSDIDLNDGWQDEATTKSKSPKESKNESSKSDALAKSGSVAIDEDLQKSLNDEQESHTLSPEDIQMYEQENVQLLHELQGLEEEVEQIEKNVVDIARLQDIFTEKVTLQQHNIDRIANAVVGATENVKDANEQIKQAIQRNAGLRVYILFFLLVMSFALLFLDWFYE